MKHVLFWVNEPTGSTTVRCQHCGVEIVEKTPTDVALHAFTKRTLAAHKSCKSRAAILHIMPGAEAHRTLFECRACGAKEAREWPSPAVAEAVTSTRGVQFIEEHRACKVPT